MSAILIRNGNVLDPRAGTLRRGHDVLVEDSVISKIDPGLVAPTARIIDAGGRTVMPGLIDCHVHVTASHLRYGLSPNRHLPASLVTLHAARSLKAMLMRGFTTVRDAGGADLGLKLALEAGLIEGPRLFISGRAISQTGGHGDFRERIDQCEPCACSHLFNGIGRVADGLAAVQHAARDEIRMGADQIKVMASGGVASAADPVHFLQYSVDELSALVDEAARADTYVMAHAYTDDAVRRCLAAGVRSIEHANFVSEETVAMIGAAGAYLVPTFISLVQRVESAAEHGLAPGIVANLQRTIARGRQVYAWAHRHGVPIGLGTDLWGPEAQLAQLREFEMRRDLDTPAAILRSATVTNAALMMQAGKLGTLAAGACADLLVVDGDPLSDIGVLLDPQRHLKLIMKDGQLYKNEL